MRVRKSVEQLLNMRSILESELSALKNCGNPNIHIIRELEQSINNLCLSTQIENLMNIQLKYSKAITKLPELERQIILDKYQKGLTLKQIASQYCYSERNVTNILQKAIFNIQKLL